MTNITKELQIVRGKELVASEMDNEIVMMSVETGAYYGLNEVGTKIWSLISEPVTIESICSQLQTEFDVTAKDCEKEVLKFIDGMIKEKMIEIVG